MRAGATLGLVIFLLASGARALEPRQAEASPQSASAPLPSVPQSGGSVSPALAVALNNPQTLYQSLSTLKVDATQIYPVHNLTIRRDGVTFTFAEGNLAFLEPLDGRVTGAVFLGRGRIFSLPPDAAERASVFRFLHVPLVDAEFWQAYLRFNDDTADEIRSELARQKIAPASNPSFAENWAPIVAHLNPGTALRVMESWLTSDPRTYFYSALESIDTGPYDVIIDERRPENVMIGQPRRANGGYFFNVWTSYASSGAPPPVDDFLPLNYDVDTTIAGDLSLTGSATLHLKALNSGNRVLDLELSRFLKVQSISDGAGHPLVFFQNADIRRQDVARRGNDVVFVVLPQPSVAGNEYQVRLAYHGTVIEDDGNGVYFVGARGSWYPHLAGPERFTAFDLHFRWPKRLTLVATGHLVDSQEEGDTRSGDWRTIAPIAVAGFNLGDYASLDLSGKPAIDLFANQQLEAAIVARLQHGEEASAALLPRPPLPGAPAALSPAPLTLLPNPAAVLRQLGGKLLDCVHFYEGIDGPFPFPELDVSQIPGSFGEGWPGLLYLSTMVFLPPSSQEQAGLDEISQEQVAQIVPFHEVAHQWWGNVVVPESYRDVWIEEAMANYQALMFDESRDPAKHEMATWLARYREALLSKSPGSDAPVDSAGPLDFGFRLDSSRTPDAYNIIIYDKGTWVIHMLRMMLRDPRAKNPDGRFDGALRSILDDHRFQSLSNAQFEQAFERVMTASMDLGEQGSLDWFFDEWVHDTGIPTYSLTFRSRPHGYGYEVVGTLDQDGVSKLFTMSVPIYAARANGSPEFLGSVPTTGPATAFHFFSRLRPARLLIDPDHTILCTIK